MIIIIIVVFKWKKKIKASPQQHSPETPANELKNAKMKANDAHKSTCDDFESQNWKEHWQETKKAENIYSAIDEEDLYIDLDLHAVLKKDEIVPVQKKQ